MQAKAEFGEMIIFSICEVVTLFAMSFFPLKGGTQVV
jgi:hypothetical protein